MKEIVIIFFGVLAGLLVLLAGQTIENASNYLVILT
jgi:hypothetical protein